MKFRGILWLFAMLIAGCTSAASTDAESSEVTFEVQGKTYDEVWSALERVAGQSLTIIDENKAAGSLKASRGVVMGPWGNEVEFSVRPAHSGASQYSIELESTKQAESRLPTSDWANTMVYKIKAELGQ
ncbi:MAG: hypothetical protein ACLQHK_03475 [Gallionellaceae bacterium]